MDIDSFILSYLDGNAAGLSAVAQAIWDNPESGLKEFFAAKLLAAELARAGFTIKMGVGQMPTAFVASWGSGSPVIAILGEYDALPGLSQKRSATKEPITEGAPGHACGHNLLGAASLGAALATKQAIEQEGLGGTIRFYGCPAEETLVGKVFMAREGVFHDLDAALTWHPGYTNAAEGKSSSLAMNSFRVNFYGAASHAASVPHMCRSALYGAQLMDIGVNYLREHVEQDVRMHSVITHGGDAPNIVPPYAQIWYYVRAPRRDQVEETYARVLDIAKGAALMSGTTYNVEFLTGCYNMLPNQVIGELMQRKLERVGAPKFSDEEKAFAQQLQKTVSPEAVEQSIAQILQRCGKGVTREDLGETLCEKIVLPAETFTIMHGSTEVGDVSQIAPTASFGTCCHPLGAPGHSWQITAASGSGIGTRGMMLAAKTLALVAIDLLTKPETIQAARAEFEKATGSKAYVSPLPEGAKPL